MQWETWNEEEAVAAEPWGTSGEAAVVPLETFLQFSGAAAVAPSEISAEGPLAVAGVSGDRKAAQDVQAEAEPLSRHSPWC